MVFVDPANAFKISLNCLEKRRLFRIVIFEIAFVALKLYVLRGRLLGAAEAFRFLYVVARFY
jgi:hypothetical protein